MQNNIYKKAGYLKHLFKLKYLNNYDQNCIKNDYQKQS